MNARTRTLILTIYSFSLTLVVLGGVLAARARETAAGAKIAQLIGKEIGETLDGKKARFTMTEVVYEPSQGSDAHRIPARFSAISWK